MNAVLSDPAFKKYRGHFRKPGDGDNITPDMYTCQSYYKAAKRDTTHRDSTHTVSVEEVNLDEDGEPIAMPSGAENKSNETKKKSEKKRKTEEINFDDL